MSFAQDAFKVSSERQKELDALTKMVTDKQIGLATDQLSLAKQNAVDQKALADRQFAYGKEISEEQRKVAREQFAWAKSDRERYEKTYKPIEDSFIKEATNYATDARQSEAAAEARADVRTAAGNQRAATERANASMGIDPTSGRFAGVTASSDMAATLAEAGAANSARQTVRDKGLALKADVANMGRGLPAQSASSASLGLGANNAALAGNASSTGLAMNAGNAGVAGIGSAAGMGIGAMGSGLSAYQANQGLYNASTNIMGQGFSGAMQGYAGMGSTLNTQYGLQLDGWKAEQEIAAKNASGIGSFLGGIGGLIFSSDENVKENKEEIADGEALDAVNNMPVEEWDYKQGAGDGGHHIGTYAQDFQRETGKGDGRTIAAQDAIGVTMKAVQDLDKKVEGIMDAIGLGDVEPAPKKKLRRAA
ncbi:tail fiber domain-containing protein [Ensifer sp. ENS04]|uniref:tail fiber domain-containing protein n=1 Tax=Ensifer sp. ENS04 TaxID=2769281 RepID=UPI001FEE5570|nr:tail fiber domain-containing protein [Ensifer sp. ENS04]